MTYRNDENTADLQKKLPWLILVVFTAFALIVARLFYLQILEHAHYRKLATEIFVREEEVIAQRGRIIDRNGKLLADTRSYFEITLTPQYLLDKDTVIDNLTRLIPIKKEDILERLNKARGEPGFFPVVVAEDIPFNWLSRLREHQSPDYDTHEGLNLSGVTVRHWPLRQYLHPELFAHVIGYLGEIDPKRLATEKVGHPGIYSSGDLTGIGGLEESYDLTLKGVDGQLARVVDARGHEISGIDELNVLIASATVPPQVGKDLKTTLDFDAQVAASEFFRDKRGAVVALDPRNGEVLVMFSSPGFDANRIIKNRDKAYWGLLNDPRADQPFVHRAISSKYPPGSTYKPVTLLTGLTTGVIDPLKTRFNCAGGLKFGNRFFKCWLSGGHGPIDTVGSLGQSCDTFFYNIAKRVHVDDIARAATQFGLGKITHIDLPHEGDGLIPTAAWKLKRHNEKWYDSENLSIAIGQSYNEVTTLQNAKMTAMIANGGYHIIPHVGMEILSRDGQVLEHLDKPVYKTPLASGSALSWIQKGMIEVVQGRGTAKKLKSSPYKIAGKTGTSQVVGHDSGGVRGERTQPHALFISYAPYDNPLIAVAVIVENGRSGSAVAAPVAQKVIDTYLAKVLQQPPALDLMLKPQ